MGGTYKDSCEALRSTRRYTPLTIDEISEDMRSTRRYTQSTVDEISEDMRRARRSVYTIDGQQGLENPAAFSMSMSGTSHELIMTECRETRSVT